MKSINLFFSRLFPFFLKKYEKQLFCKFLMQKLPIFPIKMIGLLSLDYKLCAKSKQNWVWILRNELIMTFLINILVRNWKFSFFDYLFIKCCDLKGDSLLHSTFFQLD